MKISPKNSNSLHLLKKNLVISFLEAQKKIARHQKYLQKLCPFFLASSARNASKNLVIAFLVASVLEILQMFFH